MKNLKLVAIILMFSNISFGQENRISIGLLGSYDKYDIKFKPDEYFNYEYDMEFSYSSGLNVKYYFSEKIFSKGIIQYSKRGYSLDYNFRVLDPGDPFAPRESKISLNYIGIPLFVGYTLLNGDKFKIAPSLGLVNEFLISTQETTVFEDNSERKSKFLGQKLNKYLISSQVNMAFEYHPTNKIFLCLEPYLRIGLNSMDSEKMESNSVSYGAMVSINYKF